MAILGSWIDNIAALHYVITIIEPANYKQTYAYDIFIIKRHSGKYSVSSYYQTDLSLPPNHHYDINLCFFTKVHSILLCDW